ncbi:MAG: porin family protein, partial [Mucilaginibacter sp.]|uniref:porin family protein n=1 Tax=Mucilaginibacter sp. TaxID=1882438 RepID=UPI0032673062
MKKIFLSALAVLISMGAWAQILPSFQFGVKGGVNLSSFSTSSTFSSDNRAGYLGGIWLRVGALGFNFQPEAYYASKTTSFNSNGTTNSVTLKSIDVPALVGFKIGTFGIGGRVYTGPMASFIIGDDQTINGALGSIVHLNFKNQNYAWQFGAGVDISKLSLDLRYEKGLTNLNNNGYDQKLNLFNLTAAYKL